MNPKELQMLRAAISVFARYGVRKTTMSDIAQAAGVSRQTLYNAYPGKEELIRAAVRHIGDQTFQAVKAAWADAGTPREKLQAYLTLGPLAWYDHIQESPDTEELYEGINAAARDELDASHQRFTQLLNELFTPHKGAIEAAGMTVPAFADFVFASAHGAKHGAGSRDVVETRLHMLTQSVLSVIGNADTSD